MKAGAIAGGRPSSASRSVTASIRTVMARRNDRDPHVVNETGRPLSRKRHFLKLDNRYVCPAWKVGSAVPSMTIHLDTSALVGALTDPRDSIERLAALWTLNPKDFSDVPGLKLA